MKSFKHGASRIGCALLAAAALTVLNGCGGGTSQIEPFQPTRIMAFGDEASLITSDGKKYTVNAVNADTGVLVCENNPVWVQYLAARFALVFPQCNPGLIAVPTGLMYATVGAKVADVKTKIDQQFSSGGFGPKDLAAVYVGVNDILELYGQFPAQSQDTLLAEARTRGRALADQINRIANANGRVILSTLPDMGLSPFALKEKASKVDTDRAAFLSTLSNEFNIAMRLQIINDGRLIGLVLMDERSQAAVRFPAAFNLSNVTAAACLTTIAVQDCTTKTLVPDGSGDTWLWATDTLLSAGGQLQLGQLAESRAKNNPF